MNFDAFSRELENKRRSISDLTRFISTRTDQNPNYTLLIGAGCSVSSGVRSAYSLADLWRKELYESFAKEKADPNASVSMQRDFLKADQGAWYDPSREYSSLFEKRYDLQRQRRMFVETEVAGKTPSIGYAYLTALVEQNYFNTIFTTNFDDLLNEAFYVYSEQRPIVCAHDSSINSVTVTSKRPKVIKLHGDYLFDDLKSTARETETLEQNMKAKFAEFSKDYGLIVVGYSGGDRSIMDVISALLKNEEYLKNGVYWCIRKGSEISEELRKLMWRERVYFVEIDGFDELFAELYCKFNNGDVLPATALSINRRPADIAHKLLASEKAFPSTSEVLRKARERLERQSKRTTLVNLIVKPDTQENGSTFSTPDLNDDDLILLTEIQNLISSDHYHQAIEKSRENLRTAIKLSVRLRLLRLIVQAHQMLGNISEALAVADELINIQPKNASHYLRKASILQKRPERLKCIEDAISKDPYSVDGYLDKARLLETWAKTEYGQRRVDLITDANQALERGLILDPNWRNPCWREKFDLLLIQELDKDKRHNAQSEIVETLKKQNPYSIRILFMRQKMLSDKDGPEISEALLDDIEEARDRAGTNMDTQFDVIKLKVLAKLDDNGKLEKAIESTLGKDTSKDEELALTVAQIFRDNFGKDLAAIEVLEDYLRNEFDVDVLVALLHAYADLKMHVEADQLYEKWHRRLSNSLKHSLRIALFEAREDYEASLKEMQKYEEETGIKDIAHYTYVYLKLGRYPEADKLARSVLEPIHYSPEAAAETVNLEYARKMQAKQVNTQRLTNIMKFGATPETQAAIHALLEKKSDMLDNIKKAIREDKTFRYRAAEWPVFDAYRADTGFIQATSV